MAKVDIGTPYAFAFRAGLGMYPRLFDAILPELACGRFRVHTLAHGLFLQPEPDATATDVRIPEGQGGLWCGGEVRAMRQMDTDAVYVVTTTGVLCSCREKLPTGWALEALPEVVPSAFHTPGRQTPWSMLVPVTPGGVRFAGKWAEKLGIAPGTPMFVESHVIKGKRPVLVVTDQARSGGTPLRWTGRALHLPAERMGVLANGHTLYLIGIPGRGWVIRDSARAAMPGQLNVTRMPTLTEGEIIGKRVVRVHYMRGSVRIIDVPHPCLQAAGFEYGTLLGVQRMPGGAIRIEPSAAAKQKVRWTRAGKVTAFRLGERELAWCQPNAEMQFLAGRGVVYALPAEVPNDIPLIPDATQPTRKQLTLTLPENTDVILPPEVFNLTQFEPGSQFRVRVHPTYVELQLAANGPWVVGDDHGPVVSLPRELLYMVQGSELRVNPHTPRKIRLDTSHAA